MSDLREIAITSDSSGQLWNTCIWDPHVGTTLMTYKGGVSNTQGLSFIGRDYLLSADRNKPLLHAWALNRQEQLQVRMVCPGKVSAMAVSPNSLYCVCGIGEKLHVWHVASGRHMAGITKHYQRITCIRFTSDSSHFASASEDGLIQVWPLGRVVSLTKDLLRAVSHQTEPRYVFKEHSMGITDIFIGKGGMRARLLTASLDSTSKIYDLASGLLLLSIVFDVGLSNVTMPNSETCVFLGATNGKIFQYDLHAPPRTQEYHITDVEKRNTFSEHSKAITCMSVSVDGTLLMSGSLDEQVIIWDVLSMQCLRKLPHKGSITNAFFSVVPSNIFSNDLKPSTILCSFKRESDEGDEDFTINVLNSEMVVNKTKSADLQHRYFSQNGGTKLNEKRDMKKLMDVNQQLYGFIVTNLLESNDSQEKEQESHDVEFAGMVKKLMKKKKVKPIRTKYGFKVSKIK